jgi:lipoprotein-anchoring transpeptidase ErfK/SrfK
MLSPARRTPFLVAGVLTVLVALCLGTYLYDHGRRDLIAKGVRVNGVDIGGLRAAAARSKLQHDLIAPLDRPVVVSSAGHTWTLTGRQAGLTVNTAALVDQAVQASREGSIVSRTWRGLTGGAVNRNIPLQVNYDHAAVRHLTAQVRLALNRPARDAAVSPSASGLTTVASHDGLAVDNPHLASLVELALTGQAATRTVVVPTHRVLPKVSTTQLAARYPAYIVVDRGGFTLHYYSHLKLQSSYPIAVGMQGLETPAGMYSIQWKQVNPPWYVPNDSWAGSLAGQTIPPGPQDPLKARFMSFDGGAGIHGIDPSEYGTIGHTASHGCVRMTIPDVIALYSKTPVGTPVYIV